LQESSAQLGQTVGHFLYSFNTFLSTAKSLAVQQSPPVVNFTNILQAAFCKQILLGSAGTKAAQSTFVQKR